MKNTFNHNNIIENVNSVINDKMILRFIQDNIITDKELIESINNLIASDRSMQNNPANLCLHNTMFSMGLKIVLFKYLYQVLKMEFLEQWPNSVWTNMIEEM